MGELKRNKVFAAESQVDAWKQVIEYLSLDRIGDLELLTIRYLGELDEQNDYDSE